MSPALICGFWMQNSDFWSQNNKSLLVPDETCRLVIAKRRDLHQNKKTILFPAVTCGFVHAKQRA